MVERETRRFLKCLHTNNGGEYASNQFRSYFLKHGIRHENMVLGHNNVAEGTNRIILKRMRCMMRVAQLPKPFWGEVVLTISYLINRSPSIPLDFIFQREY